MSTSYSTKCGSLLTLKVRVKCDLNPLAFQTRCTIDGLTLSSLANVRTLQCVALVGTVCVVRSTMRRATLLRRVGLRLPRGSSYSMPANPLSANRLRQRATVMRSAPTSAAISLFFIPPAAFRAILARMTNRAGVLRPRDQRSNILRSFSIIVI